jgi:hypothetical protein
MIYEIAKLGKRKRKKPYSPSYANQNPVIFPQNKPSEKYTDSIQK